MSESEDTIGYYDRNAARFACDTAELDMSALRNRFLQGVRLGGRILDAGCGAGRDALAFIKRGYSVVALDASAEMVRLTRERVAEGAEVLHMRFEDVIWQNAFDGIWACASLLHVPAADLPAVAARLAAALRPRGICYLSFKYGAGERTAEGRHFSDYTQNSLAAALCGTGLDLAEAWITADVRAGRPEEQWLNAIALAPGGK